MTVYIDILLAENLILNYVILYTTGKIYKAKIKIWRIILSSLIGATYTIVSYMKFLDFYPSFILKILLSISMVYVAFNPKNLKIFLKLFFLFYLTSFVFGGVAFALLYFIKPQDILIKNGIYIGMYPFKIVLLSAITGFSILILMLKIIKGKITKKELLCNIKVKIVNKEISLTALIDTGNFLKEPITGADVIVVEKERLIGVMPENILENLELIINGKYKQELSEYETKMRIIPFSSLGKQNGILLGIKADEIRLETEDEPIFIPNAIIGIYDNKLSSKGTYNALIGLNVLEGGKQYEFSRTAKE